jgi:glutamine synthetase
VDANVLLTQILDEAAVRHNLAALLHEKPFQGVNGSGKHNNWSLRTACGANLFSCKDMLARSGDNVAFAVVMAALVQALDEYGSLLRLSITVPGNEFRLGACEAPPAIMSVYLGEELTRFLDAFRAADPLEAAAVPPFREESKMLTLGPSVLAPISIPAQDRNRTSPFPFIQDRFEFRAVGSSQNVSMVNTVLAAAMAKSFKAFSERLAADPTLSPAAVAQEALNKHWKVRHAAMPLCCGC